MIFKSEAANEMASISSRNMMTGPLSFAQIAMHQVRRFRFGSGLAVIAGMAIAFIYATFAFRALSPELATAALMAIPLLAGGVRVPGAVFAFYVFAPAYANAITPYLGRSIMPLLAVFCTLLCLPLIFSRRQWLTRPVRIAVLIWTSVAVLVVLATTYAPDRGLAQSQALDFLLRVYLPCFLGIRVAVDTRLHEQFFRATVAISALVIAVGLLGLMAGTEGRLSVFGANPVDTGRFTILLPMLAFFLFGLYRPIERPFLFFLIPIGILVTFAAGSRGPIISAFISALAAGLVSGRQVGRKVITLIVGMGAVALLLQFPPVLTLLPGAATDRITNFFRVLLGEGDLASADTSVGARVELLELATRMFIEKPALGYGTGGFRVTVLEQYGPDRYTSPIPHNLWVQFASDYGAVGLFVSLTLLSVLVLRLIQTIHGPYGQSFFALGLFAFLNTLTGTAIIESHWIWGIFVMVSALQPYTDQSKHSPPQPLS